jgi:DNA-binding response OmpR family regulator
MNKAAIHILLAEDDSNLGFLLEDYLRTEGFEVSLYNNGELALQAIAAKQFDICLLDVMMPIMDGFTLAKEIRKQNQEIPIVFITAKSLKEDKLKGYEIGADDYILKPFDEEELKCKILALTRRTNFLKLQTNLVDAEIGSYLLSVNYQALILNGVQKRLTEREFEILNYLYQHKNKIIKREEMLLSLWGENNYFYGRSLDVFITKIRKYLKDDPSISIENVFGVGFVFHCPH